MHNVESIANEILNTKILSLGGLLRIGFGKKAWSVKELLDTTSRRSIKYEPGCTARLKKAMPEHGRWMFSVKCAEIWSKGPYKVRFKLLPKGRRFNKAENRQIEISCNCNAWKYNGADFNALSKDYSERQFSNGAPPNIRDRRRRYLICKHVANCIPILKNYFVPNQFRQNPE